MEKAKKMSFKYYIVKGQDGNYYPLYYDKRYSTYVTYVVDPNIVGGCNLGIASIFFRSYEDAERYLIEEKGAKRENIEPVPDDVEYHIFNNKGVSK